MYFVYSLLLTIGIVLMSPLFLMRREKYAAGLRERLGNYPEFEHDGRPVIWLHCVSVGEANAARPLVDSIAQEFPSHRIIVSTTTKTGQDLAKKIFAGKADIVFYFPFDWMFSVRRALQHFKPSVVLLMETEIWPRLISEAKRVGATVAIVNGRLSDRSFKRYSVVRNFLQRVLADVDAALMQSERDAQRIERLGMDTVRIRVTGNLKFEQPADPEVSEITGYFRDRFGLNGEKRLIVAASTHDPEERLVLRSLEDTLGRDTRLMIVPRHPQRFDTVASLLKNSSATFVRRSDKPSSNDALANVILLDSIGELRSVYPLADIVFVGGSLIPHGGQSILEPAAAGRAIVTGPFTSNFDAAVRSFLEKDAIVQIPRAADESQISLLLRKTFDDLRNNDRRLELGRNASAVMDENRGAADRTIANLTPLISRRSE